MKTKLSLLAALIGGMFLTSSARAADGFEFSDDTGKALDVKLDSKIVARYMYAHDTSTKEKRLETYKPYLHVFDADGKEPITQGAGGKQFPHHRGIYIGWQQIGFDGKTYNLWEMGSGDIVHKAFSEQKAGADEAHFTSQTEWVLSDGRKILTEERTMTFRRGPAPFRVQIGFTSKLTAPAGDVSLSANAEHGGVQFRPAGDIDTSVTSYVIPKENADAHKDFDYPWVGETFGFHGKHYSVVDMNHPDNPKKSQWSAYRDYGRFGVLAKPTLKSGESITLKYGFLIADGDMPDAAMIQKSWDEFAGVKDASPVPTLTVKPAEHGAASKPKAPAGEKPATDKPEGKKGEPK